MNDENELLEPLATEAGQEAIVRAIRDISSLEYAVRAEQAASQASAKAGEASQSAIEASEAEDNAKDWATKTDGYVEQETITTPPEQEGEEPTTETINLYSARYYAALAQDIYNNMSFDSVPTENSTNMVSSGTVYSALDLKADKSTTYTKTETDNLINTRLAELVASAPAALDTLQELATALGNDPNFATTIATQLGNKADKSDTYTKTEVDTALSNVQGQLTFDNVPTANSDNPVKSSGIKTALDSKQDTLTFDSTPTVNSTNPVTSGGVYTALQNVNIDIDDEITEDSDNPVTSAAIYEALQNFTPSGGDSGGAGNASGVIREELWSDSNGWSSGYIDLSNPITDYDFIEFVYRYPSDTQYRIVKIVDLKRFIGLNYSLYGYDYRSLDFTVANTRLTKISGDYVAYEIYGIKFSKNLSEQMYSNVLYENSSGWSSGSITLSDSLDNYDFIEFQFGNNSDVGHLINSVINAKVLYDRVGQKYDIIGYSNRYFNFVVTSKTQLTYDAREWYVVYKIIGHKLAKGGYSGIVSDARMTVKSGFVDWGGKVNGDQYKSVTFDSPMPDTNYIVLTSREFEGLNWADTEISIKDKTVNGFTLYAYSPRTTANNPVFRWIAIRPNSYTREGMVEDVLFSNASGVNSGTINLSGNISDYDLIQISLNRTATLNRVNKLHNESFLTTSTELQNILNSQGVVKLQVSGNDYIYYNLLNDNVVNIVEASGSYKIYRITGIKFGRYVSGVAVDTTVTQNSDAVVTSGAVYDALQNIPSGGGGGGTTYTAGDGINITNDEISLEVASANSIGGIKVGGGLSIDANGVLSIGEQSNFEELVPSDVKVQSANEVLYTDSRTYYKKYGGVAAAILTLVNGNTHAVLVSDNENAVKTYSSYDTSVISGATQIVINGQTYYYSNSPYGWDGSHVNAGTSHIRRVDQSFNSNEAAALYIINNILTTDKTLSDYNITDAYTKTEVDALLQNAGGSSITVDSTITQGGTNPVEGGAIYTALDNKADKSTTYTKTEVDTALASKGDVTTNTDQNITGTKTFVGSKKIAFKQSATNDKLGFTLYGNTGTERGYLEFNPTNTIDGVTGLMTLGNYATSAGALTQVGFRRYSNISGASGAYNLLMPMVADARTPFSLTTSYTNFYLPLGFTDGTTTVKTAKSGLVDLSPLLASLESRIAALEGN